MMEMGQFDEPVEAVKDEDPDAAANEKFRSDVSSRLFKIEEQLLESKTMFQTMQD